MSSTGPGKQPPAEDDGFLDHAGAGPHEEPVTTPSWVDSGHDEGMFADSAMAPDQPGFEVRTQAPDGEVVPLQDHARDPSTPPSSDEIKAEPGPEVEHPVFKETEDGADPYEFKDDGVPSTGASWVDVPPERTPKPKATPTSPAPEPVPPASTPSPAAATPAPAAPTPAPAPAPATPAPTAPTPAPAAPTPSPAAKPAAPAPRPAAPAAKAPAPAAKAPAAPAEGAKPSNATPGGGGPKKGFNLDDMFARAKKIKDDKKPG